MSYLITSFVGFNRLYTPHIFPPLQNLNVLFKSIILDIYTSRDFILCLEYDLRFATSSKCIPSFFRSFFVLRLQSLVIFLFPKWFGILPQATQLACKSVTINAFSILCQPILKGSATTSIITDFYVSDLFFFHQGASCIHFLHPNHSVKVDQLPHKTLWLSACIDVIKSLPNRHPSHLVNHGQPPHGLSNYTVPSNSILWLTFMLFLS